MRYFNVAPEDMQFSPYIKGGEPVVWEGVTPNRRVRFALPSMKIMADIKKSPGNASVAMNIDTICFLPDEKEFYMVWRGVVMENISRDSLAILSLSQ